MFGKVSTLMIALKIMLLCPWNYGSQYKKGEGDSTGVPCQGKNGTVCEKQKGIYCHYREFVRLENLTLLTNFR